MPQSPGGGGAAIGGVAPSVSRAGKLRESGGARHRPLGLMWSALAPIAGPRLRPRRAYHLRDKPRREGTGVTKLACAASLSRAD